MGAPHPRSKNGESNSQKSLCGWAKTFYKNTIIYELIYTSADLGNIIATRKVVYNR